MTSALYRRYVYKKEKSDDDVLKGHGYIRTNITIAPTLQGSAFVATKGVNPLLIYGFIRRIPSNIALIQCPALVNQCHAYIGKDLPMDVVIKSANKNLYKQQRAKSQCGRTLFTKEDIKKEAKLMQLFKEKNAPSSIIKYYDFLEDDDAYYLIMERGGCGLFEFVVECHRHILNRKLSLTEWKRCVRIIFAEMVAVIDWLHNEMKCCLLDISLENFVVKYDTHFDAKTGTIKNLGIRFIDFGLSELFPHGFECQKFVGKMGYQSPEVVKHRRFHANKADIFGLGTCLFMMSIGAPPFGRASTNDAAFCVMKRNKMHLILHKWDRWRYVDKAQYELMMKMMYAEEAKRYSIADVVQHEWIRTDLVKDENGRTRSRFEFEFSQKNRRVDATVNASCECMDVVLWDQKTNARPLCDINYYFVWMYYHMLSNQSFIDPFHAFWFNVVLGIERRDKGFSFEFFPGIYIELGVDDEIFGWASL